MFSSFIKAVWAELWPLAIKALWVLGKREIRSCVFEIGCGIFLENSPKAIIKRLDLLRTFFVKF